MENPRTVHTLEDVFEANRALVFGIGGSGDVVGSMPTARMLEAHGVEVLLGGLAWEPVPHDPEPGPRPFREVENLERVSETVGLATDSTRTHDGVEFTETRVARELECEVALIDITPGVHTLIRGLKEACEVLSIDLLVGVDAGGDALAEGNEPGLRSPVADALGLLVLDELDVASMLGMFGYGSDGELSLTELEENMGAIMKDRGLMGAWGLTPRVIHQMQRVLPHVATEASRLPVEAALGEMGRRTIRHGAVQLRLTPPAVVTFYFDPGTVATHSRHVELIRDRDGLDDVLQAFREAGYRTEFDSNHGNRDLD